MSAGTEFDFWRQQALARRNTRRLLVVYALAVAFVIACFCLVVAFAYALLATYLGAEGKLQPDDLHRWRGPLQPIIDAIARVPGRVYAWTAGAVGLVIAVASLYRMNQLREGGSAIAELLGARYIEPGKATLPERRLLNVVEEMAIASGVSVPPVYVIEDAYAVNALVAGHSPNEAVIIATRGAVTRLSRDELQGVMGHEFSHLLNGDMVLNLRLVGVLAGLRFIEETGVGMVEAAMQRGRGLSPEQRGGEVISAMLGAVLAFVGFPGICAADAVKAAISRQREYLADQASVQFTRNPEGIAGALDTILAVSASTHVAGGQVGLISHMFFAQAVSHWWGFPTHPPIDQRIRRAHPRFRRSEYRKTRHGRQDEVAVIDGSGSVVKTLGGSTAAAEAEAPRPALPQLDFAAQLLAAIPLAVRERTNRQESAVAVIFALALGADPAAHAPALDAIESRRGLKLRGDVEAAAVELRGLKRTWTLPLVELALPRLKQAAQAERDALIADFRAVIEADRRVTLSEFVLFTYLRQHLREGAGRPIRTQFRKVADVRAEALAVLSLVARASRGDANEAFRQGFPILGLPAEAAANMPIPSSELAASRIDNALERLRLLDPFEKPRLVKACLAATSADAVFHVMEVELVRMVAATLDCPLPPGIAQLDPATLRH